MKQSIGLAIIAFVVSVFVINILFNIFDADIEHEAALVGIYSFLMALGVFLATS